MTPWIHSAVIATSLAATVAIGLASAAIYADTSGSPGVKGDRLPIVAEVAGASYLTIETRHDGVSVLSRVPVAD